MQFSARTKTVAKWMALGAGALSEIEFLGTQLPHLYDLSMVLMFSAFCFYWAFVKLPPKKDVLTIALPFVIIGSGILGFLLFESREAEELETYGVRSFGIVTYVATEEGEIRQHGHFIEIMYVVDDDQYNPRAGWQGDHVGDTVVIEYSRRHPSIFQIIR